MMPNAQAANATIAEKAEGDVTFVSVFDKNKKQNTTAPKMRGGKPVAETKPEKGKEYKVAPAPNVLAVPTYSRREFLAGAVASRDNPAFARTAVNRVWAMMLGRGLVNAPDWDHPRTRLAPRVARPPRDRVREPQLRPEVARPPDRAQRDLPAVE